MKRFMHDAWWRLVKEGPRNFIDRILLGALGALSLLHKALIYLRNIAYERGLLPQVKLSNPVISVGNLTLGGTGKTSCVEWLSDKLISQKKHVAILSRGYGNSCRKSYRLTFANGEFFCNGESVAPYKLPDEPMLLAMHLEKASVLVGRQREKTGWCAIEECRADVLILDDGFQYRRLSRDLEVVLVSADMPFCGWPIFPRGPMREPISSISRADIVVVTKADQFPDSVVALKENLARINPKAVFATAAHEAFVLKEIPSGKLLGLESLSNMKVSLLSSIGDPSSFEESVRRLGSAIISHSIFPDHYRYNEKDIKQVFGNAKKLSADAIITTEKDLMRLGHLIANEASLETPIFVLEVSMRMLTGENDVDNRLNSLRIS
jgi:tetraacyldisaccharide 4'-kinase